MISLTGDVGLKMGPLVMGVLLKHWFHRLKKDYGTTEGDHGAQLKQDSILYDQVFAIVKEFLRVSTSYSVEEIQSFSNARTPAPPWVHVVRTVVPLSCCDEAATYLIKALGGEDVARQAVGGVKWWQVRGVNGVDAQWMTMKRDWREAKRRHKMKPQMETPTSPPPEGDVDGTYDKDMDAMRCILYLHGGGYYFGSVDQTRYSIQRYARKINGRVFAINYRLAPQYPFPCGLHDALSAYLFLIRPPPESDHRAINPAHIIISGDSAGGGLSLALLQVIRDTGLPLPAGGVLISPWCDLAHSFASVHQNTKKDFIPETGLSFHKPSLLWPPPSSDISKSVHASLRSRIKQAFDGSARISQTSTILSEKDVSRLATFDSPSQMAGPNSRETVVMKSPTGEDVKITGQLQYYTVNSLLQHPLVSPITGYLGGLPPLLFIAGDDEVLRDEIIYTAHKAAYPERYPVHPNSRLLCPHIEDVEKQHKEPTSVHLQVYDGTPHILPVLFPFTTPAKFCFRAIANFDKFVTDMRIPVPTPMTMQSTSPSRRPSLFRSKSFFSSYMGGQSRTETQESASRILDDVPLVSSPVVASQSNSIPSPVSPPPSSFRQVLGARMTQAGTFLRRRHSISPVDPGGFPFPAPSEPLDGKQAPNSPNDSVLRFQASPQMAGEGSERMAGEPQVYENIKDRSNWECRMIRERVSTSGVIRPLEPEDELAPCKMPHDRVAELSEETLRRYFKTKQSFDQRYANTMESIEINRRNTLAKAKEDTIHRVAVLHQSYSQTRTEARGEGDGHDAKRKRPERTQSRLRFDERVMSSPGWTWSWALDELENPPPSSIVARRDTQEARKLAAFADWATRDGEPTLSGNQLWNVAQNIVIASSTKAKVLEKSQRKEKGVSNAATVSAVGGK